MNIGKGIYYKLKNTATVTAYTSNRIYPKIAPQGAKWPHITYNIVSNPPIHVMKKDAQIYQPRVQVDAWSTSYDQCRLVAKTIENTLRDFTGVISTGSSGITVHRAFFEEEGEITEISPEAKVTEHIFQQYIIWYATST